MGGAGFGEIVKMAVGDDMARYKNSMSKIPILGAIVVFAITLSLGYAYGSIGSLVLGLLFGATFLVGTLYGAMRAVPAEVEVTESEVTLHMYSGRLRRIPLDEIECLVIYPPDTPQRLKRKLAGGYAKPFNGAGFSFTREIGDAIREAYFARLGRYPDQMPRTAQLKQRLEE